MRIVRIAGDLDEYRFAVTFDHRVRVALPKLVALVVGARGLNGVERTDSRAEFTAGMTRLDGLVMAFALS